MAVSGYSLVMDDDGLYVLPANAAAANGKRFATLASALEEAGDGGKVTLLRNYGLPHRIDLAAAGVTLDLGGFTLSAPTPWAFNIGEYGLTVTNGSIACAQHGFYVTDGELAFRDCEVVAAKRVVQVHGAGSVLVAKDARLATTGHDPVVFAVGGFNGRAQIVSQGKMTQRFGAAADASASCVAGNPDDTFGAFFRLKSAHGVYSTLSGSDCLYHPDGQGGDILISGGWLSSEPDVQWLAENRALRAERLNEEDGWRVYYSGNEAIPEVADDADVSVILADAAAGASLSANITTIAEYENYRSWARNVLTADGESTAGAAAVHSSGNAWLSYALGSTTLPANDLSSDDITIDSFASAPGEDGSFSLNVGIKDIAISPKADKARLASVFAPEGSAILDDSAFSPDNVDFSIGAPKDGKATLTIKPKDRAKSDGKAFFMRVRVNK